MSTDETRLFLEAKAKLQAQETQPAAPPSSKRGKAKSETPSVAPVQERVPVAVSAPAPHVAHAQAQEGQQAIPIPQPLLAVDAIREGLRAELDALRQERGVMQASIEAIRAEMRVHHVVLAEQLACVREELQQIIHTQHDVHVPLRLLTEAIEAQTQAVVCDENDESQNIEQEQEEAVHPPALDGEEDAVVSDVEQHLPRPEVGMREPEPILLGAGMGRAAPPALVRIRRWEPVA